MSNSELSDLDLKELAGLLHRRELSPVEATNVTLKRIEDLDPQLHAYATILGDFAIAAAQKAEAEIARGEIRSPLHGVPIAIKDLCAMRDVKTACGMPLLAERRPNENSTVAQRLMDAGAIILGKLQLTEGAYSMHHPDIATPLNPWGTDHWTGVSSSGSGVATAAGLCFGSLGTDTGGSIRFPSVCCGVVGLKPTFGRVSRHGVFPLADTLDHVGPMTRSVADAAAMLNAIAGKDPKDPTTLPGAVPDYESGLLSGVKGICVGIDREICTRGVDPVVSDVVFAALDVLAGLGAEIREVRVPSVRALVRGWSNVCSVEAARAHARTFPSQSEAYGPALREFLEEGAKTSAEDYAHLQIERLAFGGRLQSLFEEVDLLVLPAMPTPTPLESEAMEAPVHVEGGVADLVQFTAPFDFSGSPTLSLPGGFDESGLPLGFQIVGRHLEEALLCRVGHAFQTQTAWHRRRPNLEQTIGERVQF